MRWAAGTVLAAVVIVAFAGAPLWQGASLTPDDYRYLANLKQLSHGSGLTLLDAAMVDNRWDHLWWVDQHEQVRFFRPMVLASFVVDTALWGSRYAQGLYLGNQLIYLACVLLAFALFLRWLGTGPPLLGATVCFAAFSAHADVLHYVSGRTDSLAALFFLGAAVLHVYGRRWLAVPLFALAALTKELTLVLPVVLVLADAWTSTGTSIRARWPLWSAHAAVAATAVAIRIAVTSAPGYGQPFPYFVTLGDPRFPAHLWTALQAYSKNLVLGAPVTPFLQPDQLKPSFAFGVAAVAFAAAAFVMRKDKRSWLFFAWAALTFAPTVVVYVSARYLLLPSVAVAALIGLALERALQHRVPGLAAAALIAGYAAHQAWQFHELDAAASRWVRQPRTVERALDAVRTQVPKGAHLLLVNLPGGFLDAQFIESVMQVQLDDPSLRVATLTMMPNTPLLGSDLAVSREDERTIKVEAASGMVMARQRDLFPWVPLRAGTSYRASTGITAEVLGGAGDLGGPIRFTLPEQLEHYVILQWLPAPNGALGFAAQREQAIVRHVEL
jgi:hypothetical protein